MIYLFSFESMCEWMSEWVLNFVRTGGEDSGKKPNVRKGSKAAPIWSWHESSLPIHQVTSLPHIWFLKYSNWTLNWMRRINMFIFDGVDQIISNLKCCIPCTWTWTWTCDLIDFSKRVYVFYDRIGLRGSWNNYILFSYNRLGRDAEEADAEEIIDMAGKASFSDQQQQVQDNIHSQIKRFCLSMDEILLLPEKNVPIESSAQSNAAPRRSGLSFAVGPTARPTDSPGEFSIWCLLISFLKLFSGIVWWVGSLWDAQLRLLLFDTKELLLLYFFFPY